MNKNKDNYTPVYDDVYLNDIFFNTNWFVPYFKSRMMLYVNDKGFGLYMPPTINLYSNSYSCLYIRMICIKSKMPVRILQQDYFNE